MPTKLKINFTPAMLTVAMILSGCSSSEPGQENNNMERKNIELTRAESDIAQSLYDFPVNLLAAAYAAEPGENVVVSPLSVSMVLGMMANAMEPEDRQEILDVLNIDETTIDDYNTLIQKLLAELPILDPQATLSLDNSFWITDQGNPSPEYISLLSNFYKSEMEQFETFSLPIVDRINDWVKEKTKGAIPYILTDEDAGADLKSLWLNTIYFKDGWTSKFDKSKTETKPFYTNYPETGMADQVQMMYCDKVRYNYGFFSEGNTRNYDNAINTVILPYGNESFIFTAVLPPPNNPDIKFTLEKLDSEYWKKIDQVCSFEIEKGSDIVYLPKLNLTKLTDLIPVLRNTGVNQIFDPSSGFNGQPHLGLGNGKDNSLSIGLFRQNVVLDVDEDGSEIKVATASGDWFYGDSPLEFNFNRPFIYFVRERSTGAVLLAGIYQHPE